MHIALTGDLQATSEFEGTMASISIIAQRHPSFAGQALAVWTTQLAGIKEVAITGQPDATGSLEAEIWNTFRPNVVVAINRGSTSPVPLLEGRPAGAVPTAYVCENLVCTLPVRSSTDLRDLLGS